MDWEYYAHELENIISNINLQESTRILVDRLVQYAKENSIKKDGK